MKRFLDIVEEVDLSILSENRTYETSYENFYDPTAKDEKGTAYGFNVKETWSSSDGFSEDIFRKQNEFIAKRKEFTKKYFTFLKNHASEDPLAQKMYHGLLTMVRSIKLI